MQFNNALLHLYLTLYNITDICCRAQWHHSPVGWEWKVWQGAAKTQFSSVLLLLSCKALYWQTKKVGIDIRWKNTEWGIKGKSSKNCENRRGNRPSSGKIMQSWHHLHYAVIGMTSLTLKPLCAQGGSWRRTNFPHRWPAARCLFLVQRFRSCTTCYWLNYTRGPIDGRRESKRPNCPCYLFTLEPLKDCDVSTKQFLRKSWSLDLFCFFYFWNKIGQVSCLH